MVGSASELVRDCVSVGMGVEDSFLTVYLSSVVVGADADEDTGVETDSVAEYSSELLDTSDCVGTGV